ncbi:MAG: hypothetical protein GF329_08925 [Candidatus Lokiarchaeota archaeon]|nr:hypothetical protein [Candidatus Lokiarchaeota archaeon]
MKKGSYNYFLQKLEESFDVFLKDDRVNEYLYRVGDTIEDEGVIISGYEIERGNWGTYINGKVIFGENQREIDGMEGKFLLSPNFFHGKNFRGEKTVYRLGLEKKTNKINLFPVVIKEKENNLEGRILDDLCVIFSSKVIDRKTAIELEERNTKNISINQQFLTCFWNIDDYIRKLNPKFNSDELFDVWTAIETISSRIIDQMLYKIIEKFKNKPEWMIKDAIDIYESNLMIRIENYLKNKELFNANQLKFYVKNLCSYMNRFKTDKPLRFIIDNAGIILPVVIDNITLSEREAKYEAFITFKKIIKIKPTLITKEIIEQLFLLCFHHSKKVRDYIGRLFIVLFSKIDQITNNNARKIIIDIKNSQKSKKDWILFVLYRYIFEKFPKIVDKSIVHNFNNLFLNTRISSKLWDLYVIYEIIIEKYDRLLPLIAEDLLEGLESGSHLAKFVTMVYGLISEQSPSVIKSIIEKLLNLLIDEVKLKQDKALAALIMILKDNPQLLGPYKKKFVEFLEQSDSNLKNQADDLLSNQLKEQ